MSEILKPKYKYYGLFENLEKAEVGQIFWAGRNYNKGGKTAHAFVVVDNDQDDGNVYGAMLSSSKDYNYILINNRHFKQAHHSGEKYKYPTKETLFVPKKFVKFQEWAPFFLIGEITDEGLEMIRDVIGGKEPEICRWNYSVEAEKIVAKKK